MLKSYNNYSAKKSASREALPAGGYICKIRGVNIETYYKEKNNPNSERTQVLVMEHDVVKGPYKDHFLKDYQRQTGEDKKWRGTIRLFLAEDDGSEKDSWTKRTFENSMWAFEASNPGFHFDWDEQKLEGLIVGVLYRNKEWEKNGNRGWTTESCALTSIDDILSGNFKTPKDKPLKNAPAPAAGNYGSFAESDDDDLPWI